MTVFHIKLFIPKVSSVPQLLIPSALLPSMGTKGLVLLLRHMVKDCLSLNKYPTALHPGAHGKQLQRIHHMVHTHTARSCMILSCHISNIIFQKNHTGSTENTFLQITASSLFLPDPFPSTQNLKSFHPNYPKLSLL